MEDERIAKEKAAAAQAVPAPPPPPPEAPWIFRAPSLAIPPPLAPPVFRSPPIVGGPLIWAPELQMPPVLQSPGLFLPPDMAEVPSQSSSSSSKWEAEPKANSSSKDEATRPEPKTVVPEEKLEELKLRRKAEAMPKQRKKVEEQKAENAEKAENASSSKAKAQELPTRYSKVVATAVKGTANKIASKHSGSLANLGATAAVLRQMSKARLTSPPKPPPALRLRTTPGFSFEPVQTNKLKDKLQTLRFAGWIAPAKRFYETARLA